MSHVACSASVCCAVTSLFIFYSWLRRVLTCCCSCFNSVTFAIFSLLAYSMTRQRNHLLAYFSSFSRPRFNRPMKPTKHPKTSARQSKLNRQHLRGRCSISWDILMCNYHNHVFTVGEGVQSLGARPRWSIEMEEWSLSLLNSGETLRHSQHATLLYP